MKSTFNRLAAPLLTLLILHACHVDNAKVVETKKQTTTCVIGIWTPEEPDVDLNTLEFHAANMEGGENGNVNITGGMEQSNGTWQYQEVGEIHISTPSGSLDFKLLNCKRGILDRLTIYVKE